MTAGLASEQQWHARWEAALEALELDVAAAEELLRVAHLPDVAEVAKVAAWHPPAGLGPLPAPLLTRARTLLDRQLEVAGLVAHAAVASRRQAVAARALRARPAAVPVYLDAEG
ncbi:hypothetical protein KIN34_02090 [Cellulomonas sp. DKR-3]|uniref:DUF222 domain-containing protein n=1 Tax=Cellulomonas fulva TaxID=2835530 RepID=A0ABS5TVB2_9CELL|nr:hypothetical protein [Cellulomonas fulva]MBT0993083.1 hypothetical protein [Cellulomonas fulva]